MAPNPRTREGSRGTTSVDGCARATEAACTAADRAALRPPARFRPVTGAPGAAYWTSALARPAFSPAARKGIVARAVRALSAGEARLWRRQPCATPSSSSHVGKQYSAFRLRARDFRRGFTGKHASSDGRDGRATRKSAAEKDSVGAGVQNRGGTGSDSEPAPKWHGSRLVYRFQRPTVRTRNRFPRSAFSPRTIQTAFGPFRPENPCTRRDPCHFGPASLLNRG